MFVHDRQFFTVDPARSLYNVMSSYASIMLANSALTVVNAGIFMLLMYSLIGARPHISSQSRWLPVSQQAPIFSQSSPAPIRLIVSPGTCMHAHFLDVSLHSDAAVRCPAC